MSRIAGGVLLGEALQRHQQERLPRQRGDVAEPLLDRHARIGQRLGFGVQSTEFQILVNSR